MKTKSAILVFLFSCFTTQAANAGILQLQSYKELLMALKKGHHVTAIYDASKCKLLTYNAPNNATIPPDSPDLVAVIGMDFTSHFFIRYRDPPDPRYYITVIADDTIAGAPSGSFYRLKSLVIYDDDTVRFYASKSIFPTGKAEYSGSFACEISTVDDERGLSLFDHSAS